MSDVNVAYFVKTQPPFFTFAPGPKSSALTHFGHPATNLIQIGPSLIHRTKALFGPKENTKIG